MGVRSVEPDKEKIRTLRLRRGWTAEVLAKKAGCAPRSVGNAEAGKGIAVRTLNEIAGALEVNPAELMKAEIKTEPKLIPQVVLSGNDTTNIALLAELIAKTIQATGEITIKFMKGGSVIVALQMTEADVLQLARIFADFREHARAVIAQTPEGKAYFVGSNPQGLDLSRVEAMLTLVDRVRELRLVAEPDAGDEQPDSDPISPPDPPQDDSDVDFTPLMRALARGGPDPLKGFDPELVEKWQRSRKRGNQSGEGSPTS
jgi:transcriptional regulator with XRE-family HTH domain